MDAAGRLRSAVARMHDPWGGALCLDFANTLEPRGGPPPCPPPPGQSVRDELADYDDLVAWAVHKGALGEAAGLDLIRAADDDPDAARSVLERAHLLRDAVYRVFWALAYAEPPRADDLAALAREHAAAAAHAALVADAGRVRWSWPNPPDSLARPLWPVAWSATELLTNGDPTRVKVCPGTPGAAMPCAWLFFDATRNRARRWCSMSDCGGATKARRQTARRRGARAGRAAGSDD